MSLDVEINIDFDQNDATYKAIKQAIKKSDLKLDPIQEYTESDSAGVKFLGAIDAEFNRISQGSEASIKMNNKISNAIWNQLNRFIPLRITYKWITMTPIERYSINIEDFKRSLEKEGG